MTRRRRIARGAALGATLIALVVVASAAIAKPSPVVRYDGHIRQSTHGDITLRLRGVNGSSPRGTLRARELPLGCEDGSLRFISPRAVKLHFKTPREFTADRFTSGGANGVERYLAIHGSMSPSRGRAVGYIVAYKNPEDPPASDELECSTKLDALWTARRGR